MSRHPFFRLALPMGSAAAVLMAAALVPGAAAATGSHAHTSTAAPALTAAIQVPSSDYAYRIATTTFTSGSGFGQPQTTAGGSALPSHLSAGQMPHTPDIGDNANSVLAPNVTHKRSGPRGAMSGLPTTSPTSVTGASTGLISVAGNNAYDEGITHLTNGSLPGVDVEPPDQGLCAGNGYTMELNNEVERIFSSSSSSPHGVQALENLFGTPELFGGSDGSVSVQGDPRCFFDSATNRWFASQLWLDLAWGTPGDHNTLGPAGEFVAVSTSSDPTGSWNSYFIPDMSNATGTDGCTAASPCFGDQPLLGVDANSVQISTNEYSISGQQPNGNSNLYFLSKTALLSGASRIPMNWAPVGDASAPEVGGYNWSGWASLVPAQVPDGKYNIANNGTSYALSSLDFAGTGDNKIAEWVYTNTNGANTGTPIEIYEQTLGSGAYAFPPNAVQAPGPTPLGDSWNQLNGTGNAHLPEGALATNDDRMTTAAYDPSTGTLLGALNTGLDQTGYGHELAGIAYFTVTPSFTSAGLAPSSVTTGYVSAKAADVQFPVFAVTPAGTGVLGYSLSGATQYPSTAYSLVAGDAVSGPVHIARAGAGPQDGFTEYLNYGSPYYRPRWGDYSGAAVVGNSVTFATEMINQSCTKSQFQADFTCGGTRDLFANWGTSVNTLTP